MTMVDPGRFPNIVGALREAGLDPMTARVPVAPAQPLRDGRDRHRPPRADERSSACTPSASARAPGCTEPTGSRRTHSASASCSAAARRSEASTTRSPTTSETIEAAIAPPTPETRAAVWRLAGLERDAQRLTQLRDDPHPLARLVAGSALAREETRGAHGRAEFPDPDPALDHMHTLLDPDTETPRFEAWTDS